MSDDHNNDSTGSYLLDAIARFAEKHEDFIDRHPKVDVALGFAMAAVVAGKVAVDIAVSPVTLLRYKWKMANTPLTEFEPEHEGFDTQSLTPPYWQDLVFGDGRFEKLLSRLDGAPTIDNNTQKHLLQKSEGGLKIFPQQEQLLKYGLNDSDIYNAARAVSRAINQKAVDTGVEEFTRYLPLTLTKEGVLVASQPDMTFVSREAILNSIAFMTELKYFHKITTPVGKENIQHIAGAVYDWLREDVAPVVPNIFGQYKAETQHGGSLTVEPQPEGYERQLPPGGQIDAIGEIDSIPAALVHPRVHFPLKDIYEILAEDYKGTLPVYATPVATPQAPQP